MHVSADEYDQEESSERRYRNLFRGAPAPLWEEDFSEVKRGFERLRQDGVIDFAGYLRANPEAARDLASRVRVLAVNDAAVRFHRAASSAEQLARIAAGERSIELEVVVRTLDGEERDVLLQWAAAPGREQVLDRVYVSLVDITRGKRAERELLDTQERLRRTAESLRRGLDATVQAIATMGELRDPYTAGHQKGVSRLAEAIAIEMGLPERQREGIRVMGFVHDIGKVLVPAEILSKPGKLTALEFEMIKQHTRAGYEILKPLDFPWPVAQGVLQHHERLDGSGYPEGLRGETIIVEARILAVADVVEAMVSHRPYRPGLGMASALSEIQDKKGRVFDTQVVDACLALIQTGRFTLAESAQVR